MKNIFYILVFIAVTGCYEDDSQLIQSENTSHNTSEISTMLKSVTANDTSFDNLVDNSSCISIDFPYQVLINEQAVTINNISDLQQISPEEEIDIIYPINTVFFNYDSHQADNRSDFNLIKDTCNDNLNLTFNTCIDIHYPITIKEYNDITESFDTFRLNSNKELFLHIETLHDNDVFEIEFPIFISKLRNETIKVESNEDFQELFYSTLNTCG